MNSKDILSLISEETIFTRYFGSFDLKKYYCNPWRDDKNPNCYFKYRNGILYFIDFGNSIRNINCFQACMYYYNCDYQQALEHIDQDFNLNLNPYGSSANIYSGTRSEIQPSAKNTTETVEISYSFIYGGFTSYDIKYWSKYGYTKELIELMKIKSVRYVYRNNVLWKTSYEGNPIFTYSDSIGEFKIYQPLANKFDKWRSIRPILEGYELLPAQGDLLFITSSYKDVGVLKKLGYAAIAPSSETSFTLLYEFLPELKKRFKHIYVFHNNDEVGKKSSIKVTKEQCLYYVNLPNELLKEAIKDPSDLVAKKNGLKDLDLIIKNKLQRDGLL